MTLTSGEIWTVIVVLGLGTFLIRFSFLGIIGDRKMPDWVLRHLRYTPVAVLPGLVAPLVLWRDGWASAVAPEQIVAALVTVGMAWWRKNLLWGFFVGFAVFLALKALV